MKTQGYKYRNLPLLAAASTVLLLAGIDGMALAQTETTSPAAEAVQAPEPLNDEELEILVARIALYPDELVAVIAAASLYPVQIVEADRYLEDVKTDKNLQPKATWDGSVISLLNYPMIVEMMSEDLDWTQLLGEAIVNQEKDVLAAIQQLREKAVAEGIIKTDDKVKVVEENDNIVIQPASTEVIYVPQYEPEVLYVPDYQPVPIYYYPDPYPHYYYPHAGYWAGFVTGAIWGGIVDWDDGFWGGDWWGDGNVDIDIDCRKCFNDIDFDGKVNIKDVDWRKVDRNKISFDKNQFGKIDRSKVKNSMERSGRNKIENKAADLKKSRPTTLPGKTKPVKDVRSSTLEGLKSKPTAKKPAKPAAGTATKKPDKPKVDRPVGKPKPAAKVDKRPAKPSPMGDVKRGKPAKLDSNRGAKSMGGGMKMPKGGGGHKKIKRSRR